METLIKSSSSEGCRLVQSSVFYALLLAIGEFSEVPLLYSQNQCIDALIDQLHELNRLIEEEEFSIILSNLIRVTKRKDLGQKVHNHLS